MRGLLEKETEISVEIVKQASHVRQVHKDRRDLLTGRHIQEIASSLLHTAVCKTQDRLIAEYYTDSS